MYIFRFKNYILIIKSNEFCVVPRENINYYKHRIFGRISHILEYVTLSAD